MEFPRYFFFANEAHSYITQINHSAVHFNRNARAASNFDLVHVTTRVASSSISRAKSKKELELRA